MVAATLVRKRLLVKHYNNRQTGETTQREISPQRLVHYRDNWYGFTVGGVAGDFVCSKRGAAQPIGILKTLLALAPQALSQSHTEGRFDLRRARSLKKVVKNPMNDFEEHLRKYGIVRFDGEEYWSWGGEKLGDERARQLERLRKPLVRGNPKRAELFAFYEYIADPEVGAVVHSMKADAIRATGEFLVSRVAGTRVLETGCGLGYFTTWVASAFPDATVVGLDVSPRTVSTAKRLATTLLPLAKHLQFEATDVFRYRPSESFDTILDAQGCIDDRISPPQLAHVLGLLKPAGQLLAVPALGTEQLFESFLSKVNAAGGQVMSCTWVRFSDLGSVGGYPGLVIEHGSDRRSPENVRSQFAEGLSLVRSQM